jgi:hypothetical protein
MRKIKMLSTALLPALLVMLAGFMFASTKGAQAAAATGFKAGRIMDDIIFTKKNSMSASQIQSFLNSKMPSCDTNGDKSITYHYRSGRLGNSSDPLVTTTRKIYGQRYNTYYKTNIGSTPFTCLRNYTQNTKTAAQIIYQAAQDYSINPQVLIVLLQKEQGLVTDDWPWKNQYKTATGYGCPDTAACDSQYYGFTNQVRNAANMFRNILNQNPDWYTPYSLGNNRIYWNPNTACGYSTVNIENLTTVALYSYTPYRPNQAALDAGYGTGNSCSSYGNRNFYQYFKDWFGPPVLDMIWRASINSISAYTDQAHTHKYTYEDYSVLPNSKIYFVLSAKNTGNQTWDNTFTNLGTYLPKDRDSVFEDTSWQNSHRLASLGQSQVKPGQSGTFSFVLSSPSTMNTYVEGFSIVADGKSWVAGGHFAVRINVTSAVSANESVSDSLGTASTLHKGSYIISQDLQSVLVLQTDGNLVLYNNLHPVWSSRTSGTGADKLSMQTDGNLVLYNKSNKAIWNTKTAGNPGASLVLQTDGNLVLYNAALSNSLWSSSTPNVPNMLEFVNPYYREGGNMYPKQRIQTADRQLSLVLQTDGNLVLYNKSNKAIWNSRTYGHGVDISRLSMQTDGNLVLYNKSNKAIWNTKTAGAN